MLTNYQQDPLEETDSQGDIDPMAWPVSKSEGNRSGRMPLLSLAGWGLVATMSFVIAFMALQFSMIEDDTVAVSTETGPQYTGSINAAASPQVGIMQRGPDAGKPSKTQELATEVDLLRNELVALRRSVASIRESRNDLAVRLTKMEESYQGFTTTIAKTSLRQTPVIPTDPQPISTSMAAPELPPMPPIPLAAPPARKPAPAAAQTKIRRVDEPQLTTASLPDPAKQPEKITTESTDFAVDLGGFSSLATLGKGWKDLKSDQKTLLGNLSPRATLSDKNGRLEVRLVAGPFKNAAHAITLCAQLQARSRSCQPSLFVGQPVETR